MTTDDGARRMHADALSTARARLAGPSHSDDAFTEVKRRFAAWPDSALPGGRVLLSNGMLVDDFPEATA